MSPYSRCWRVVARAASLALTLFAAGAVEATPIVCDATCAALKQIIAARGDGFRALKAGRVDDDPGNAWLTTVRLLDLECRISDNAPPLPNSFGCSGGFTKAEALKRRDALLAGLHAAEPGWRWLQLTGSNGTRLRGGPSVGALVAWIDIEHYPAEAGGPVTSITVGIAVDAMAAAPPELEPYSF